MAAKKPQLPDETVENPIKPHYFEVVMNSYSAGILNQECILVREYAATGAQLTAKQMAFTKSAAVPITQAIVDAMDEQSKPIQDIGMQQMIDAFEAFTK
jgi:hypothetical protein